MPRTMQPALSLSKATFWSLRGGVQKVEQRRSSGTSAGRRGGNDGSHGVTHSQALRAASLPRLSKTTQDQDFLV